ncbi:MAG: class II fructose-bisphosphate aldolase [Peptostreptococcaceae bacterium]
MLVSLSELLNKAKNNNYAVPSANFFDSDSARSYVEVAAKMNLPIILSYAQVHEDVLSLEEAALLGKYYGSLYDIPVALHLDHGTTTSFIKKAVDLGFTSVMIDASKEDFEENVKITKEIVEYAHAKGVSVEAEIGHVGAGINYENHGESDSIYTEVSTAIKFVEETNIDAVAVSIGTAHGLYKGEPIINFERLDELSRELEIPIVLHGGSSSGDKNLEKCATSGISKINIFTDFIVASMDNINDTNPSNYFDLKKEAIRGIKDTLEHYYEVFHTKCQ